METIFAYSLEQLNKLFADAIKKQRKRLGLNQTEFGKLFDVSQVQVSKWEDSKIQIEPQTIDKICEKLNLKVIVKLKPNQPS